MKAKIGFWMLGALVGLMVVAFLSAITDWVYAAIVVVLVCWIGVACWLIDADE